MSGAFRLREAGERARWYPETREIPNGVAYGLTEHERDAVSQARLVANPGCYPTTSLLALLPLADAGVLVPGRDIVIDAKSGVSGAGRTPTERTHFSEVHGSMSAYGVFGHRHGAEIEQGLGRQVTFTPHLAPLDRGILATIYVRVPDGTSEETLADIYGEAYAGATFVRPVGTALPEIKHVAHTNFCDIGWRVDPSGRAIVVCGARQPREGGLGPGRAEHERHARAAGDNRPAVSGRPVVVKFGGELLEQPDRLSTVVGAMARVSRPHTAGGRARRRQGDRCRAEGRGHREAAGRRPSHHRRPRRWRSWSGCWRDRSTPGWSRRSGRQGSRPWA